MCNMKVIVKVNMRFCLGEYEYGYDCLCCVLVNTNVVKIFEVVSW